MPFFVIALSAEYIPSQSLKSTFLAGEIVSSHQKMSAAETKARKLNDRLTLSSAFHAFESDDQLIVGQCYPEVRDAQAQAILDKLCVGIMEEIIDLGSETIEAGSVLAFRIDSTGLSFAEIKEKYADAAQARVDDRTRAKQEYAEMQARKEAIASDVNAASAEFCFTFPAARGIQADKEYYTCQIPFSALVRLFSFDSAILPPEQRAQRQLNESRAKKIAQYILSSSDWVLPALTASVSVEMQFNPVAVPGSDSRLGVLSIPFDAALLLNDGQHRRAGIEIALKERPELKDQCVPVTIFFDQGLQCSQQIFSDINNTMSKPSTAISSLYDQRSGLNRFAVKLAGALPFSNKIDLENSSVGNTSSKLWSLVALKKFIRIFTGLSEAAFNDIADDELDVIQSKILSFFGLMSRHLPAWQKVVTGQTSAPAARDNLVVGHTVFFEAMAYLGKAFTLDVDTTALSGLQELNMAKSADVWSGRCVVGMRMIKSGTGVKSTAAVLLKAAGQELPEDIAKVDRRVAA